MVTIKDLAELETMIVDAMRVETRFARAFEMASPKEQQQLRILIERNPQYVARAYAYLPDVLDNATDKHTVIMAWIAGEAENKKIAEAMYDEAMAQGWSPTRLRREIRAANGVEAMPRGEYATLAKKVAIILQMVENDSVKLSAIAALPQVAKELE